MTLTQMRYFATTCELQNISLAAQMLYISQPALSATLADLEKEVDSSYLIEKAKVSYQPKRDCFSYSISILY